MLEPGDDDVALVAPGIAPRAADCYRDYARVLAFDAAGAPRAADDVRGQMRANLRAGARDQWESAGGRLYTTALTALASR